jgi:hypothetical protein
MERLGQTLRKFVGNPGKHVVAGIIWRGIEELADNWSIDCALYIDERYVSEIFNKTARYEGFIRGKHAN